ncbi:hypothetical protein J6590_025175 [Homalodisca vitripennis]|nr:hypothetical protein J6590_025175 [Homalodisca vitripennis]
MIDCDYLNSKTSQNVCSSVLSSAQDQSLPGIIYGGLERHTSGLLNISLRMINDILFRNLNCRALRRDIWNGMQRHPISLMTINDLMSGLKPLNPRHGV